ncbi:hypothetical protein DICPUDRAFT_150594 [Dictyostelium purpureum]|uniref:HIT-type domain-containing protein n=1 Tax=Dictyostelium purpureum TaxID=5786 RepID=F0ZGR0_DICPU|nr:uncharacterized protein DICPUDRAFT_150594 [Dictyostelium purpureum]EGC36868.1 hypothetical protein DICPUDRAFT_150594 [Dictyostelium purpureum]|eukprot:XP_003286590.1 hypothetical protein DICPUDRAFT_150594 [Dictyostelium purpureum]
MSSRKIHHLDSSPPLSFLIIKDNNKNTENTNKPIVQNAGRFKKVQITILNEENENNSSDNNNNIEICNNNDINNIKEGLNKSEEDNENDKLCKICNKQFSLYTCPRCNINYCSLVCFKSHNSRCSTEFFEGQLKDNLKNIERVSPKESLTFLKRMKEIYDVEDSKFEELLSKYNLPKDVTLNQLDEYEDYEDEEDEEDDGIDLENLNLDEMTEEELLALLTKDELEEFNKSIKDGTISNLIDEWVPWWNINVKEIENNNGSCKIKEIEDDKDESIREEDNEKESNEIKLLLSRIPIIYKDIQPLSKLISNKPSKSLYFHLIDILYCYCFLTRTFNGEWGLEDNGINNNNNSNNNIDENNDTLLEGCKLILDLSTVLKSAPSNKEHLALYQAHLSSLNSVEGVIKNLLKSSHSSQIENNKNQGNIYFSLFLLEDLISILNNQSFILSSISHLFRSFKSSIAILKSNYNNKIKETPQKQDEFKKEYQLLSNCFENISKKLLFFLSWVSSEDEDSFKLLSAQVYKYFNSEKSILLKNKK